MKDKKKGITDETIKEIGTVSLLLQRINEEYARRQKEVEIQDRANAELLTKATGEEKELIKQISEAEKIVKKMISDYGQVEVDVESTSRKKIEKGVLREADVRKGKVSLMEFREKGKYDAKIAEEVLTKSVQELESLLPVIRDKNLEILRLKERLGSCQNTIRNLIIRPGMVMLEMLKGLYEFTDVQVADFMNELSSLRTEWDSAKRNILFTQGKSMSGTLSWSQLSMKQARDLQFDPILPLSSVGKLKSLLAEYEGSDGIALTYYLKLKELEITSITPRRGLIQTTQLKEHPDAKLRKIK